MKHCNLSIKLQQGLTYIGLGQHNHFLGGKGLGIQHGTSLCVGSPKSLYGDYSKLGQIIKKEKRKEITIFFSPTNMLRAPRLSLSDYSGGI